VTSSSKYLQGLLGATTPSGPGSAPTLRPPRRIFDAAPEPEVAGPSRPETAPEPLEPTATPVQGVPADEPSAAQSASAAFAPPGAAPAGLLPLLPVPSANTVGPRSDDFSSSQSAQAVPAIVRKPPDPVPAVSHIVGAGPALTYGDDPGAAADEVPPFPAGPSPVVMDPVMDRPPAAAPAPPAGQPLIVDHGTAGRPPADVPAPSPNRSLIVDHGMMERPLAGVPALPTGRAREDYPGSAPRPNGARPEAVRPSTLNPAKTLSDGPSLRSAGTVGPSGRQPAAAGVRSQVTIGTIEVTVVPPPAPLAMPQIPGPAPTGPVAPAGHWGAVEAVRRGGRRWFGAGQG
jgi:hypothetical protein